MPPKSENPLQFLTDAHVAIVAGKGGVGKTTVTAVLARAAADQGLRVLVVELDGKPALASLVGDIPCLALTPPAALAEYLETHGLGRVAKRLATSGVIEVVATAAPGIDDIVVLGKIKQLEQSRAYDLVVVDGPAAGHAITFLKAPANLLKLVRGGPIRSQAAEVAELLTDGTRSQVILVTLPETTPVNEVIETAHALRGDPGLHLGPVVVNAFEDGHELVAAAAPAGSPMQRAAEFRNARRDLHRQEIQRLAEALDLPRVVLPELASPVLDAESIATLAAALEVQCR
ncbi:MAG TPA: ArsA family ATPase [Ilumatobacteraceae bacterium]|nr:ArsA family ATPase [Ilumatobacteraceae bacterium]